MSQSPRRHNFSRRMSAPLPSLSVITQLDPYQDLHQLEEGHLIDLDETGSSTAYRNHGQVPNMAQPQHSLIDLSDNASDMINQSFPVEQRRDSSPPSYRGYSEECRVCSSRSQSVSFCNVCNHIYCSECWDGQFVHKHAEVPPRGIPHEKTSISVAQKVYQVLKPEMDDQVRERLHIQDAEAAWFGVSRPDRKHMLFQDYGRFTELMDITGDTTAGSFSAGPFEAAKQDTRTPSLVSFVGETGAGKSTLIKLLIDLNARADDNCATPIVGASGADLPTSEDVHLYIEPCTAGTSAPVLFADCEGLTGGNRMPLAARWRQMRQRTCPEAPDASYHLEHKGKLISEREISWAKAGSRSREFVVTNLYPRLLYTFSDVVVFVLRNTRVVESVFERLIEWAAAALEMSSNQPVLPHAVIVLNACGNDIEPSLWDPKTTTEKILQSLAGTVNHNAVFRKQAEAWRERNYQITTVEQLMGCFYSSVKIIRIPEEGRPNLIEKQVGILHESIRDACSASRSSRASLRMLLDVEELQSYLDCAFDHFARTLDQPFDFVQASLSNSPIPLDFGGNILKLAISLMEMRKDEVDAKTIFEELSYVVASCIMFDLARKKNRGAIESIFPRYLEHLDAALENFCNSHWPCEFVKSGTSRRCVNVRSGHAKGHQSEDGKVLAVGNYQSQFSYDENHKEFQVNVYLKLKELHALLCERILNKEPESSAAADIHKNIILVNFVARCSRGHEDAFFNSHTACFCCLFELPEHVLPCGHIICTLCAQAFGFWSANELIIFHCPLCPRDAEENQCKISLKPKGAGVRILTLDGGGMRGIIELEILQAMKRAMGGKLPIQVFFDLIVGTSTGGLIALGLVAKAWSVDECLGQFKSLCSQAFTRRAHGFLPMTGFFHSIYKTTPLQKALLDAFGENEYLFGGRRMTKPYGVRVAVTAASAASGTPVVISNYSRACSEKLPYQFQRPERLASELKVWQAGRATSAAPPFFKSFNHEPSGQVYLDGALYYNNPIAIAKRESKLIWPDQPSEFPDIVVSLGTGASLQDRQGVPDHPLSPRHSRRRIFTWGKDLFKIAKNIIDSSLDCEKAWEAYIAGLPRACESSRSVRVNPEVTDLPQLDDVDQMENLQATVQSQLRSPEYEDKLRQLAMRLVATTFFFEVQEPVLDDKIVKGSITCRLSKHSPEVGELGKLIKSWSSFYCRLPFFLVYEKGSNFATAQRIWVSKDVIEIMILARDFYLPRLSLTLTNKLAPTEVRLCFDERDAFPISGSPRVLFEDVLNNRRRRRNPSISDSKPNRWVSQFNDRQARWTPPDMSNIDMNGEISVKGYPQSTRPLGHASPKELEKMAHTLKYGTPSAEEMPQSAGTLEFVWDLVSRTRHSLDLAGVDSPSVPRLELAGDHGYDGTASSTGIYEMPADGPCAAELPADALQTPSPNLNDDLSSGESIRSPVASTEPHKRDSDIAAPATKPYE